MEENEDQIDFMGFNCNPQLKAEFSELAKKRRRSITQEAIMALEAHIKKSKEEEKNE